MSEPTPNRECRFYMDDTLWSIVETDISALLASLQALKPKWTK